MSAGKWTSASVGKKSHAVPLSQISSKPSFKIHVDEGIEQPTPTKNTIEMGSHKGLSVAKKVEEPLSDIPVAIFEPPDPKKMPMYCKHLVYQGTTEYSFEEIRAIKYRKRIEEKRKEEEMKQKEEELIRRQEELMQKEAEIRMKEAELEKQKAQLAKEQDDKSQRRRNCRPLVPFPILNEDSNSNTEVRSLQTSSAEASDFNRKSCNNTTEDTETLLKANIKVSSVYFDSVYLIVLI